jgi:hypothetical protein
MKKEEEKKYTNSNLSRYKNSEDGERYNAFLSEKGYQKELFEKKTIQEQGVELSLFFETKKWKLSTNRQGKTTTDNVPNTDNKNIIKQITGSNKCNSDEKIKLIERALTLVDKEKELAKLQEEIEVIKAEINAVI